jgi:hypothetical protein
MKDKTNGEIEEKDVIEIKQALRKMTEPIALIMKKHGADVCQMSFALLGQKVSLKYDILYEFLPTTERGIDLLMPIPSTNLEAVQDIEHKHHKRR